MKDGPRYATLRDYLRVLREQRVLIIVVTIVFTGMAIFISERTDPKYEARASVAFIDPNQDVALIDPGTGSSQQAVPERASINAKTLKRPQVLEAVRRKLRRDNLKASQLRSDTSARVEAQTGLLVITAQNGDPDRAARIANAFADRDVQLVTQSVRTRAESAARGLRRRQRALTRSTPDILTRAVYQDRISRLEALASFARPAQVAERAVVPDNPISPKPARDALLGALLGLTLGILAAFVRDALDRRLRSVGQIQEEIKLPVVGRVRDEAMGRSGPVANGRGAMEDADLESFRILRANLAFLDVDRPMRSLVVTSPLEGEGKSTVATSLAFANAWAGQRTLLVECDLRRPVLAQRLHLESSPGLADFLAGNAEPQDIVQRVPVAAPASTNGNTPHAEDEEPKPDPTTGTLACIVAGTRAPRPAELLASERFAQFLAQVSEVYDAVILDTAPMLSVADTLGLVARADGVLVCVRAQRTTRDQVRAARAALERLPERPAALVVTGVKKGDESEYGYYYSTAETA